MRSSVLLFLALLSIMLLYRASVLEVHPINETATRATEDTTPPTIQIAVNGKPNGSVVSPVRLEIDVNVSDSSGISEIGDSIDDLLDGIVYPQGQKDVQEASVLYPLQNGTILTGAFLLLDNGTVVEGQPNEFNVTIIDGQQYWVKVYAKDIFGNLAIEKIQVTFKFFLANGDLNNDNLVDIFDAILLANVFGTNSNSTNWNPYADLNGDGLIDILDAIEFGQYYGESLT